MIPPRKPLQSTFLSHKIEADAVARAKSVHDGGAATRQFDTEYVAAAEAEELDDLKGRRVHCWVVVLPGKRMLEQLVLRTMQSVPSKGPLKGFERDSQLGQFSKFSGQNLTF